RRPGADRGRAGNGNAGSAAYRKSKPSDKLRVKPARNHFRQQCEPRSVSKAETIRETTDSERRQQGKQPIAQGDNKENKRSVEGADPVVSGYKVNVMRASRV
ncbi:hypothetical protein BaRGS_00038978, partial [Batillaria attramentaria]